MKHIVFSTHLCNSLKMECVKHNGIDDVIMFNLPLEVGNITNPEQSRLNEKLYEIIYGKSAIFGFRQDIKNALVALKKVPNDEEICFWIDFNDADQHSNFVYFLQVFGDFQNKYLIQYDFNLLNEDKYDDKLLTLIDTKSVLDYKKIKFLRRELMRVQTSKNILFRTAINGELVAVKDNYFDQYILEFLSTKPKKCSTIIGEVFKKYGRYAVTFDQIIIRLWMLFVEEKIERVEETTEYGLFFEYSYKLSDVRDMILG